MFGRIAPGPRPAALLIAFLIVLGVVAAGPAGGAGEADFVRVVVQFDEAPLAQYRDTLPGLKGVRQARTADGHLDVRAPASRAYLAHLASKHADFEQKLRGVAPDAAVHWRYDTALNGMTMVVPRSRLDAIRRLPNVLSVTETYELEFELDESRSLLGLQTLWQSLPASPLGAGAGARVALIDSGVNAQHPFFDAAGFTAPPGYPKAQRVAGGVRTNLPVATYASNKVIVGNVYAYPGDTTATPWGPGSLHATHVAGIMAGKDGTYEFTSGPATFALNFSGMAPGAYVMSYRLDGDSAEFIAAIEDVVADQADALNISLGHSRWLTTDPAHDPIRAALDAAVDAGTIVVASAGNAGANGDSSITGSWKLSPKVITVANSSHARVFSNAVTVTGPGTPPATLIGRPGVPASAPAPPIASTISGELVVAPSGAGGNAGDACTPLGAGSVTGKIALVARGNCTFDVKMHNVMAGGAVSWIVHNNGPDAPIAMGGLTEPAIPGVMVTLADGRALVAWAAANASPTVDIEGPLQRLTSGWPDVVAGSSSRGPAPTMGIKPDIAAPGSSVLSSVVNDATGAVAPAGLFNQVSGTSMASPHVTALAALTEVAHPGWTPAQVKSALQNTADTEMSLDLEGTIPALAKHRGAGRVDAARLANPQLTFDPTTVSFGLVRTGETKQVTITATDVRASGPSIGYAVSTRALVGSPAITLAAQSFSSAPAGSATFTVGLTTAGATAGDYEGFIEVAGGGQTYTIPYFVRVQDPAVAKDVLLLDWDRNVGGADFRPVYEAALTGLGLSYDVFNGGTATTGNAGPTFAQLQNYRAVVLFTGNNAASWSNGHVGGSFPLQDFLVAGGKLVMTGQDLSSQVLYNQNTGTDFLYATMAGWLTGAQRAAPTADPPCAIVRSDRDFYGSGMTAPPPTAQLETAFTLLGRTGDVSTNLGGTGAGNQRFPDAGRLITAADRNDLCVETYNGALVEPHARVLGSYTTTKKDGTAVSRLTDGVATGVAPDPTLALLVPRVNWGSAMLHVGAEGLNPNRGELDVQTALGLLHDFVADSVSVAVAHKVRDDRVDFVASAASARGAAITKYRWDFGDGSPIVETTVPRITHAYGKGSRGQYTVHVEAVNALTRSGVGTANVTIRRR